MSACSQLEDEKDEVEEDMAECRGEGAENDGVVLVESVDATEDATSSMEGSAQCLNAQHGSKATASS
jgi:hypothetical protein